MEVVAKSNMEVVALFSFALETDRQKRKIMKNGSIDIYITARSEVGLYIFTHADFRREFF